MATAFTVKSIVVNGTYRYCGVEDSALSVTVLAFFLLGYALPLAVITALYILIAFHVRRTRRRVAGPSRGAHESVHRAPGHRNHLGTAMNRTSNTRPTSSVSEKRPAFVSPMLQRYFGDCKLVGRVPGSLARVRVLCTHQAYVLSEMSHCTESSIHPSLKVSLLAVNS